MKVLVTGSNGQLGRCLQDRARWSSSESTQYYFCNRQILDVTNDKQLEQVFDRFKPDVVINCAAYTDVDGAEELKNMHDATVLNSNVPMMLVQHCRRHKAVLIHFSTDYVFDGSGVRPWEPDDRAFSPVNVYGRSKLAGENEIVGRTDRFFIVRIAWAFGRNGRNFVKTMLNKGRTHDSVRVVNDQIGTPTYTLDLARLLTDMFETEQYGYYHATNEGGYISWYDFTREIYRLAGITADVIPVTTAEYGRSRAVRPLNSRLDKSKLVREGFTPLPDWKDALVRYLTEIGELQ